MQVALEDILILFAEAVCTLVLTAAARGMRWYTRLWSCWWRPHFLAGDGEGLSIEEKSSCIKAPRGMHRACIVELIPCIR